MDTMGQDIRFARRLLWKNSNNQDLTRPDEKTVYFTVVGVVGSVKLRAMVDPDERVGAYFFPTTRAPLQD